ncbi:hypothetical protein COV42_00220 [Candidatus Campbellbacteria bacterium CG11_big_fil_rev_8_21_14_0_20_44_21]|uniref:Conjugal transfer protein TrbC n=1 Tax=Candidatus Campbellbacteria bacterium CG22_combo_CG10-13_8_21_14_all_43_18 TaxID=1974530 RepID=A0A2H0DWR0_9BACT|nr:MAG: hypothetical protein COW82_01170 [Candidatus Campbellbacteria bacterium CG22_combo_CG10-13_8_21_14_all_43_18]PIR24502.1 MAG: hypothetical protein COV42_00220 [Candidatus Campbellbacteria bacterium CG11_big_fil_rev_8_21_14_0_20_44_21]
MRRKNKLAFLSVFMLLSPVFAFAQQSGIEGIILTISRIITTLIPIVVAAALLFFLWGLALYIQNTGSGSEAEGARQKMFWGIIALFVMVSVWGIVKIIQQTFVPNASTSAGAVDKLIPPDIPGRGGI